MNIMGATDRCLILSVMMLNLHGCRAEQRQVVAHNQVVRSPALSVLWNKQQRTVFATGRWANGPNCRSRLPVVNTATIKCTSQRCSEHIAALFGPGDPVQAAWDGMLIVDAHEYAVEKWGPIIDAKAHEPAGPLLLHINVVRKTITRERGGTWPCEWTLK